MFSVKVRRTEGIKIPVATLLRGGPGFFSTSPDLRIKRMTTSKDENFAQTCLDSLLMKLKNEDFILILKTGVIFNALRLTLE